MAQLLRARHTMTERGERGYPRIENARSLRSVAEAARDCRAGDLWVLFVGEQPGDNEDLAGHPFVGPAGHLQDDALVEAGIERKNVYVTNAVKHFKWRASGKRRLHERPNSAEMRAFVRDLSGVARLI